MRNIFLCILLCSFAHASAAEPLAKLRPEEAAILGFVEGLTEFLPISSTGHLIVLTDFLNLDGAFTLSDASGQPLWYRKPSAGDPGELLTVNLATQAYIVVIQFGAIAAIIPICWSQFVMMGRGILQREPRGRRLLVNLLIAFVPSAIIGLSLHDWVDDNLFSRGAVISGLVAGSILMFVADRWGRGLEAENRFTELSPQGAGFIGFLQCLAMWPGTSRPMMTMVGGYLAGLAPAPAAGFSFLLGFVTLSAATIYKTIKSGPLIVEVFGWPSVLTGIVVAAITASISVRFFIKLLLRSGLAPFAWYRLALAAALLIAPSE